ncbi:MAG: hypothetical protein B7Y45_11340 [Sphingomonas sp. 28-66-16]|nr:MAG: hypothetical protein B7Y45_11340 [Sphingomonas sp. 28-66-16]
MVALLRRKRLTTLPVAPLVAAIIGVMTAAIFTLMPAAMLESLILRSGIAAVLAAAEPPLGATARIVLILICGGGAALVCWFGLFLLLGSRSVSFGGAEASAADAADLPVLRRADAHPDAPARRPVFANRDLGTPFLEVRARQLAGETSARPSVPASPPEPAAPRVNPTESAAPADAASPAPMRAPAPVAPLPLRQRPIDLPDDLDQPLAAFDPGAIRAAPLPPPAPPPAPLAYRSRPQVFEPGERFETFELTPMVRAEIVAPRSVEPDLPPRDPATTQASITALLERLEKGVSHRAARTARTPSDGLQQTLGTLRQMASRG